jgi:hypothetical protein
VPKESGYGREDAGFGTLSILSPEKSRKTLPLKTVLIEMNLPNYPLTKPLFYATILNYKLRG